MRSVRAAIILMGLSAIALPMSAACELKVSTQAHKAAEYVDGVRLCLKYKPDEFTYDEALERDNMARVNQERQKRGLPGLLLREDLRPAARWHSLDMAANQFFAHIGADGRNHADRISLLDRTLLTDKSGENLAMMRGYLERRNVSLSMHEGLMESPGHRENLLADYYTHMAVGVVRYKDGVWLTQVFANEAGEFSEPVPVRLSPGQTFTPEADLKGWYSEQVGAKHGSQLTMFDTPEYVDGTVVPRDLRGEVTIRVRGDRRPPDGEGKVFRPGDDRSKRLQKRRNRTQRLLDQRVLGHLGVLSRITCDEDKERLFSCWSPANII